MFMSKVPCPTPTIPMSIILFLLERNEGLCAHYLYAIVSLIPIGQWCIAWNHKPAHGFSLYVHCTRFIKSEFRANLFFRYLFVSREKSGELLIAMGMMTLIGVFTVNIRKGAWTLANNLALSQRPPFFKTQKRPSFDLRLRDKEG